MNNPIYTKKNMPSQTFFNNDVKEIKIEDDESSTDINKEELRAAEGISDAYIFCFIFWLLVIAFIILFF